MIKKRTHVSANVGVSSFLFVVLKLQPVVVKQQSKVAVVMVTSQWLLGQTGHFIIIYVCDQQQDFLYFVQKLCIKMENVREWWARLRYFLSEDFKALNSFPTRLPFFHFQGIWLHFFFRFILAFIYQVLSCRQCFGTFCKKINRYT